MTRAVLLTGGNLGDVAASIEAARAAIAAEAGKVVAYSKVYESAAWGFEADTRFLNQVVVIDTALSPEELLDRTQQIEKRFGRVRPAENGYASRTMDIDILYYGEFVVETPALTIPHPLIAHREFVLRPLAEVLPDWKDPRTGQTAAEMLKLREFDKFAL